MASTSVPDVLVNLAAQLRLRPGLVGVAVHLLDFAGALEPETVRFTRVTMAGAAFLGWGAGPDSLRTIEPLRLAGFVSVTLPGGDNEHAAAALARGGVLLTEVAQQLRDDPAVGGALGTLAPPYRWRPPLMDRQDWRLGAAERDGAGLVAVQVDFSVAWQATS